MNLIDIGANLSHESFSHDLDAVIATAIEAGVSHIIVTGTDTTSNEAALALSKSRPAILSCTAGYHPHVAESFDDQALLSVRSLAQEDKVVAIGETGLDFNRNFSSKESQLKGLRAALDSRRRAGKTPVSAPT